MKNLILTLLFFPLMMTSRGQSNRSDLLQTLEQKNPDDQSAIITATLKTSSRLFKTKEDLSSVILVIPSGSTVTVLDSDSTYLHVTFEDNDGYIYKQHAVIDKRPVVSTQVTRPEPQYQDIQPGQPEQNSHFSYLEKKYGSSMASRLYARKVWKGMTSDMVKDSWGTADKVNRINRGNSFNEEWIFKNTWLYFENNTLTEWGPVRK